MRAGMIAGLAALGLAGGALAAVQGPVPPPTSLNPQALKYLLPDHIDWKPAAGLPGAESATLVGDPGKPGFYVVMNRFHAGAFSHPHYHPNDRYILVVSGTWWAATGATFDPERLTTPFGPGTFVTHAGRQVHYDGARAGSGDVVVMIFGQGPGTRTDCDTEKGPGPCEEARAASK